MYVVALLPANGPWKPSVHAMRCDAMLEIIIANNSRTYNCQHAWKLILLRKLQLLLVLEIIITNISENYTCQHF